MDWKAFCWQRQILLLMPSTDLITFADCTLMSSVHLQCIQESCQHKALTALWLIVIITGPTNPCGPIHNPVNECSLGTFERTHKMFIKLNSNDAHLDFSSAKCYLSCESRIFWRPTFITNIILLLFCCLYFNVTHFPQMWLEGSC